MAPVSKLLIGGVAVAILQGCGDPKKDKTSDSKVELTDIVDEKIVDQAHSNIDQIVVDVENIVENFVGNVGEQGVEKVAEQVASNAEHHDPQPEPKRERSSRPETVVSEPIVTGPGAAVQTKKSSWSVRDTLILSLVSVLVFVGGVGLVTHFKPKFFQPPEPVVQPEPVVESKPVEWTPAGLGEVVSNHPKKIFGAIAMFPLLIFGVFVYNAYNRLSSPL